MTKPIDDLLPLPMRDEAQSYMDLYHDALHELVCFGTHIIAWNLEQGKGKIDERNEITLAPILLFRHILELLDAVFAQVKLGIIVPCKIQLRAMLEAYMSLEYMLEKDRHRRATCFLLVDHYRQLNFYKSLTPNESSSKELFEELKKYGQYFNNITPLKGIEKANKNQESLINQPIYAEAKKEYLKLTNQNKKNLELKWYSLFDGPKSVKWLAMRIKKYDVYEFFYKSWSNPTHATNLSNNVLVKGDDGNGAIVQLRNMQEAHELITNAMTFVLLIFTELMIKKMIPERGKEIWTWFLQYKHTYRDRVMENRIY